LPARAARGNHDEHHRVPQLRARPILLDLGCAEIAALELGIFPGWKQSGGYLMSYITPRDGYTTPVCRFLRRRPSSGTRTS
jgi:hypothetical protein